MGLVRKTLAGGFIDWLMEDSAPSETPLCDFARICYEVRPCDVLLIEGRSRCSEVIKVITQSPWSHAALYIGRIHDIEDELLRDAVSKHYKGNPDEQLLIESVLGKGIVITPLSFYKKDHIRICRPINISPIDAKHVIQHAIGYLGGKYHVRRIIDLARFMLPWSILPRAWRSSLFEANPGTATQEICSSLIAEAFAAIKFPILPVVKQNVTGMELIQRNPRLYTPRDFDYSPYFEIIKYPFLELSDRPSYRNLPWNDDLMSHDTHGITAPHSSAEEDTMPEEEIPDAKKRPPEEVEAPPTKEDNQKREAQTLQEHCERRKRKLPFSFERRRNQLGKKST